MLIQNKMNIEYNIMTEAPLEVVANLVEKAGYKKTVDDMDYPIFRNKDFIGLRLEEADEDFFDMYQGERRDKKEFIKNPKSYLRSDIDGSLMIDEEYLIETGQLEKKLSKKEMEKQVKSDFDIINRVLIKQRYKADFYETKEGFDI